MSLLIWKTKWTVFTVINLFSSYVEQNIGYLTSNIVLKTGISYSPLLIVIDYHPSQINLPLVQNVVSSSYHSVDI